MTAVVGIACLVGALMVGLEVCLYLITPTPLIAACLVITALAFVINLVTLFRVVR